MSTPLTGRKVFAATAAAFGVIIGVNALLAMQAVRTFPGLETPNSYVASQRFDAERAAQEALGWDVAALLEGRTLRLTIDGPDGAPARLAGLAATLGRPTHIADDRTPDFRFDGRTWLADVDLGQGLWYLRLEARAPDGTLYRQRLQLRVRPTT